MTKKEIIEMMKAIDDNEEVAIVMDETDRDGFPFQYKETKFRGVVAKNAEPVAKRFGNYFYVE